MSSEETILFPLSMVPPCGLFVALAKGYDVLFDGHEHYIKQTIRNRYHILGPNGVQALTINVVGQNGQKIPTAEIGIDYEKDWIRIHKRALESAYRSAPFFDHYYPHIEQLFDSRPDTLGSFFGKSIKLWCSLIKFTPSIELSSSYIEDFEALDLRKRIKNPSQLPEKFTPQKYLQVFNDRFDFIPNLSILDLLFNEGPSALAVLKY
jgi:hypothetical protein